MSTDTCSVADATAITDRFRAAAQSRTDAVTELRDVVPLAYTCGAWKALGYPTWGAYCHSEIGARLVRIPRGDRRVLVDILTAQGTSIRAIGSVLGVDVKTIRTDRSVASS